MSELHADSIVKAYGSRTVLSDIFIKCEKGEIVGLLGRNGCGKSTMLKIIFGSLNSEYKYVKVNDIICDKLKVSNKLVKYLPQEGFLPNHIKIKTIVQLLCDEFNAKLLHAHPLIVPYLNKKRKELSGGELRVFEILLIIHSMCEYVLIDEPFNGISPLYIDLIKKSIKAQTATKGFIITDHNYRNILDISDRIFLMNNGALKQVKEEKELKKWGYIT